MIGAELELLTIPPHLARVVGTEMWQAIQERGARKQDSLFQAVDRSLPGPLKRQLEVRVPPCDSPEKLLELIEIVLQVGRGKIRVPRRAGLHVHVEAPAGLDFFDLITAVEVYWLPVQAVMLEVAYGPDWETSPRFFERAQYCALWGKTGLKDAVRMFAISGFPEVAARMRYRALNPFAYSPHKTLEYRFWPMTLDRKRLEVFIRKSLSHAQGIDWDLIRDSELKQEYMELADRAREAYEQWRQEAYAAVCRKRTELDAKRGL